MIWLFFTILAAIVMNHIRASHIRINGLARDIRAVRAIGEPLMGHDGTLDDPKASIKVMIDHDLPASLSDQEVGEFHAGMVGSYALKRDTHGATLHFTHPEDADEFKRRWLA